MEATVDVGRDTEDEDDGIVVLMMEETVDVSWDPDDGDDEAMVVAGGDDASGTRWGVNDG